jgi:hypothetical protein
MNSSDNVIFLTPNGNLTFPSVDVFLAMAGLTSSVKLLEMALLVPIAFCGIILNSISLGIFLKKETNI